MLKAALKQLPWILALFVLGPAAAYLTGSLRAADGSGDATLLMTVTPAKGVLAGLVTLVFAGSVGVFASLVNGSRSGFNAAGIVVAWAASQTADIEALLRMAQGPAPLTKLAIEGAAFALLAAPVGLVIWRLGLGRGLHGQLHPLPQGAPSLRGWLTGGVKPQRGLTAGEFSLASSLVRAVTRPSGVGAIAVTVVVGFAICWLVAQDTLKGQAIFAAAVSLVVAVPVGRLVGESLSEQPPTASFLLGVVVLAVVGPLAAKVVHGDDLIAVLYRGDLIGAASPVTLDWVAGALIGIPIGEAWFAAMFPSPQPAGAAPGS